MNKPLPAAMIFVVEDDTEVAKLVVGALQEFGFGLDDLSEYQRTVFQDCVADIAGCGEPAQTKYNSAFAQFFD